MAALDFVIEGIAKAAHGAPRMKFTCSMLVERVGERSVGERPVFGVMKLRALASYLFILSFSYAGCFR